MSVVYKMLDETTGAQHAQEMEPYVQVYAKYASDLIALKTPQKIAQRALAVANACSLMSHSLSKVENMYTDAVSGLVGIDEYVTAGQAIQDAVPNLTDGFTNSSVINSQ